MPKGINFETARICSDHFTADSFKMLGSNRVRKILIDTAVPTLFGTGISKISYPTDSEDSTPEDGIPPHPKVQSSAARRRKIKTTVRYIGDITTSTTGDELRAAVPKIKSQLARNMQIIKQLRAQNRRLNERVHNMKLSMYHCQESQSDNKPNEDPLRRNIEQVKSKKSKEESSKVEVLDSE